MVLHENFAIQQVDVFPHEMKDFPPDQRSLFLVLRVGETVYGTLRVVLDRVPSSSLRRLLTTCTVQASLALQRVELTQRAQRGKNFEEADRLKTALLHAVSHDLRTPITIIKTSANNLLKIKLPEDEQIETLKVIENEADQLDKMVGNLLDISRLKAGVLRINAVWNSLEEAAGDVAAMVWQRTGEERIKICFPDNMPLVQFDYALILQALGNLTENSLRYEPDDKRVEICGRVEGSEAQVIVANHGPSIPPEERELIMEPFYHGTGGNIGLGLAIAKGIVEAHRGRLWVEDTPGGGATFVVSLPLTAIPADLAEKVENQ
jgi:two-component system sensor histidine kinase KdpD